MPTRKKTMTMDMDTTTTEETTEKLVPEREAKKAYAARDEARRIANEQAVKLAEYEARVKEFEQHKMKTDGEYKSLFDQIQDEKKAVQAERDDLRSKYEIAEASRMETETKYKVKDFTERALAGVVDRDRAELLLEGLRSRKYIDPTSDDPKHVEETREKLRSIDASLFEVRSSARPGGIPGARITTDNKATKQPSIMERLTTRPQR